MHTGWITDSSIFFFLSFFLLFFFLYDLQIREMRRTFRIRDLHMTSVSNICIYADIEWAIRRNREKKAFERERQTEKKIPVNKLSLSFDQRFLSLFNLHRWELFFGNSDRKMWFLPIDNYFNLEIGLQLHLHFVRFEKIYNFSNNWIFILYLKFPKEKFRKRKVVIIYFLIYNKKMLKRIQEFLWRQRNDYFFLFYFIFFFFEKNLSLLMKLFFRTNKKKILFDTAIASFSRYVDRGRTKVAKDLWAENAW